MQIRYISDLHLGVNAPRFQGQQPFHLDILPNEHEQILILAGDVCDHSVSGIEFIIDVCSRFKHVLYVFGNHEYYRQTMHDAEQIFLEQFLQGVPNNLHVLNCATFQIDNLLFIGATLWTDINGGDRASMNLLTRYMNDCKLIRLSDDQPFTGDVWCDVHKQHVKYIEQQCQFAEQSNLIPIIISHHAPCKQSIHAVFADSDINCGFASDLDWLLAKYDIPFWFHGHMHHCFDYVKHNTRVLCNPYGYTREFLQHNDGKFFNPVALIEI